MRTKLILILVLSVFAIVFIIKTVSFVTVQGHEAVVRQDIVKGVLNDVWLSGTKIYSGWTTQIFNYDIGTQKITFDYQHGNPDAEYPPILVEIGENGGQKAWICLSVNYRIGWGIVDGVPMFDEASIVRLHKDGLKDDYESVILKRTIQDVINETARPKTALEIYSGKGFVGFGDEVDLKLRAHPVFKARGIYIENTILYKVSLGDQYEAEIAGKQLAGQQKLRKQEETIAAQEEAKRIFAMSQAEVEKARQEAESKKIRVVKEAEAQADQEVLKAGAEKQKRVLEAEGERDANLAKASGVLALGEAEATVQALKRESLYAGESGAWRARVEIATAQAEKMSGLFRGVQIVPERTILRAGEATGTIATGLTLEMDSEK